MDAHGGVYLADFGAAVQESSSNVIGFVGTPAYMSPEQARGEGHRVDVRTDIFALGVVLYELLTGLRPFQSQSITQLLADIITSDPPPPRQVNQTIPAELERICLKAMSKRAADRYATARELCRELREWSEGEQQRPNWSSRAASCRSFPKGCVRSKRRTPNSSCNCCQVRATGTDCPRAFASGRPASKKSCPNRHSEWASSLVRRGAANLRL